MTTALGEAPLPGKAIYQLVIEAQDSAKSERRSAVRYPFFRPVTIQIDPSHRYSAFSRDISPSGIGLLHNFKLPPREIELSISSEKGYSIRVRAQVVWCEACGAGWYVSGAEFVSIANGV